METLVIASLTLVLADFDRMRGFLRSGTLK